MPLSKITHYNQIKMVTFNKKTELTATIETTIKEEIK